MSDPPLTDCPACGASALRKKVSAAFRLKGGGWYETTSSPGRRKTWPGSTRPSNSAAGYSAAATMAASSSSTCVIARASCRWSSIRIRRNTSPRRSRPQRVRAAHHGSRARAQRGTINPAMPTGEIEVLGKELEMLNARRHAALPARRAHRVGEEVRLRYRYMDLRRPEMQQRLRCAREVTAAVRRFLDAEGFLDIETPILTRATPEGARDYLVPSRTHPGQFFALPQSPQLFKQLLMVSGFDRYYQIAKCFRTRICAPTGSRSSRRSTSRPPSSTRRASWTDRRAHGAQAVQRRARRRPRRLSRT
jgi:hypothetical protein